MALDPVDTLRAESPDTLSPEALERLLVTRKQFLAFLQKRVRSAAIAEDILQAAFVRGIEKGGALRGQESVIAWFYRILRNAVIDHYRRQASADQALQAFVHELETSEEPPPSFKDDICRCVSGLLSTLKPEYQQALEDVDLNEGSLADLAGRAGITEGNAAVRVHRAREALRKRVRTTCGMCAEHGCLECHCQSGSHPTK
jgi:RNA polymerase sigma-70 factor (ECF subfamily)